MKYSSAELTAVDLVQFADHIGGYQRAATVLAELVESMNIAKMRDVMPFTSAATIQRMGYIFEYVLKESRKADELYELLVDGHKSLKLVQMRNGVEKRESCPQNRWHVNMNIDIELDEL